MCFLFFQFTTFILNNDHDFGYFLLPLLSCLSAVTVDCKSLYFETNLLWLVWWCKKKKNSQNQCNVIMFMNEWQMNYTNRCVWILVWNEKIFLWSSSSLFLSLYFVERGVIPDFPWFKDSLQKKFNAILWMKTNVMRSDSTIDGPIFFLVGIQNDRIFFISPKIYTVTEFQNLNKYR